MKKAIFPGSFDPIHKGHLQIIKKASKLFDKIYVVITFNNEKEITTSFEEREERIIKKIKDYPNVVVKINKNKMTYEWARENDVKWLIRSARNNIDFNYELELASGNNYFNVELETILIIPDYGYINYSSRLAKQKGEK